MPNTHPDDQRAFESALRRVFGLLRDSLLPTVGKNKITTGQEIMAGKNISRNRGGRNGEIASCKVGRRVEVLMPGIQARRQQVSRVPFVALQAVFGMDPHVGVAAARNNINDFFCQMPVRRQLATRWDFDQRCIDLVQASDADLSRRRAQLVVQSYRVIADPDDVILG